jgi:diguanylate cyclase (GGDEF)-like protein
MMLRSAPFHLLMPAVILAAAFVVAPRIALLPSSLSGLRDYGPYLIVALGVAVSGAFQRGRAMFALLTLAAAQLARQLYLQPGVSPATAYSTFAALCVFVPFNVAALSVVRERGIFNLYGMQRTAVLLAQFAVAAWIVRPGKSVFAAAIYTRLSETALFANSPIPQVGLVALLVGMAVACAAWLVRRSTIELGFTGALVAFAIAAHRVTAPDVFETFIAAAALIVTVSVMQDTFRMAFRDELTGLPSRRALNERLARLPRRYTIAMLDVDRFKGLNDRFGHDVGDQVLKMVGARLARVGGGGKVYRYGGEEFSAVFPGKSTNEALAHLETLRRDIAGYRLSLRDPERPEVAKTGRQKRGSGAAGRFVSVTISIGVADNSEPGSNPDAVIQAADRALYRAKNRGRNQVSS